MSRRREFLIGLGAATLWPLAARAQQKRVPVIGYLGSGSPDLRLPSTAGFRQGLNETGYVEGQNITVVYRWAGGKMERFPALAAELVARKVDVIVTAGGTLAALAAKQATTTLPIVFAAVGDPVAEGLVTSLARPGGNVTGLSFFSQELVGKRLELLKQVVPGASLIALLLKPDSMPERAKEARLGEANAAARALGVQLQVVEARGADDFDRAFSEMSEARAGALTILATPVFVLERRRLVDLAAKSRLPAVSEFREFVDDGGLMSYGPSLADLSRRAVTYVDKILKGAKPADLPVEQPTRFELVINLKTAKALGLTVPQALLARADEIIE
jgi:putative ABC transport system substrate-binding protein